RSWAISTKPTRARSRRSSAGRWSPPPAASGRNGQKFGLAPGSMLRASRMAEPVDDKARLSGAREDFVASLGRRLQTLRTALRALEAQPADRARRNALLRRAHALGAAARVLGFASVAEALGEAERAVARATQAPRPADLAEVSRVLDLVPSLVGGAQPSLRPPVADELAPGRLSSRQWPLSLLLFGGADLEELLTSAVA